MSPASAPMVTRCPKCGTAFRITSAQLQSARGAVRCGSCLHVFKAQEHLVDIAAKAKNPAAQTQPATKPSKPSKPIAEPKHTETNVTAAPHNKPATATKPATPAQQTSLAFNQPSDDEDLLISDDMEEQEKTEASKYEFDGFLDIEVPPPASSSLFERPLTTNSKDNEPEAHIDESWAEQLIDEEDEQLEQQSPASANNSARDSYEQEDIPPEFDMPAPASSPNAPGLVFSLIDEPSESTAETAEEPNKEPFDSALFETPQDTEEPKRQVKTEPKIRAYDNSRTALLMNIIPAPVEFTAKRMRNWQSKLWPILSLVALLALIVQIAWFKFDYLSRIEPYRNVYQQLCPWLGCQLPTLIDTHSIKAYNLIVRSHPDKANALLVDAIILNTAPFEQPFPDLVLAFSDIDGKPLASRRFTPKEYLGGELAGKELMPKNQPIQLSLDLVDPGPEAVNYHVYIP